MNSQLAVIALVDVQAALNANSLDGNIYLVDNNRFMGSTGQGTGSLTTKVVGNQIVNWLVSGIDLVNQQWYAFITNISGDAVQKQILIPQMFDSPAIGNMGYWWGGTADAIIPGKYNYTLTINLAGQKTMDAILTLDVQTGFTMETPLPKPGGVRAKSSLQERAIADNSIMDPDNFISPFPRIRR